VNRSRPGSPLAFGLYSLLFVALAAVALIGPADVAAASRATYGDTVPAALYQEGEPAQDSGNIERQLDAGCRLCHRDTTGHLLFDDGTSVSAQIDLEAQLQSVHGQALDNDLQCTSCHTQALYGYPHIAKPVELTYRAYQIERSGQCERCHNDTHRTNHPADGSDNPVICTDCHGAHQVTSALQFRVGEGIERCASCHTERGVATTSLFSLLRVVEAGLFTDERGAEYCVACHSIVDQDLHLDSGETLPLQIDTRAVEDSVHGKDQAWQPLLCTVCHTSYEYPHQPVEHLGVREYRVAQSELCHRCHEDKHTLTLDSTHETAIQSGNLEAAVCTDCHGWHDVSPPDEPRFKISQTCGQCHEGINQEFGNSVHGVSLLKDDPSVPSCVDCHGVHDIGDPTTALFRIRSPQLCAKCHADKPLMTEHGISTDVFDTYVADFHGTTVTLFENTDPDAETNKAVCYDCHGVHNIMDPDDPEAGIKNNLLEVCQQCHPDASPGFPDAWASHFTPTIESNPLVFAVESFYKILIPIVVAFFILLVSSDVYRQIRSYLVDARSEE